MCGGGGGVGHGGLAQLLPARPAVLRVACSGQAGAGSGPPASRSCALRQGVSNFKNLQGGAKDPAAQR